ncbi:hypothetical protein T11_7711 [Trichinella zimbabwensis]|uniref:Uncharacterized protein n=1 Tax=Trichinella zimbabwensis TaxID=268475 RepID=A0A0V1GGE9_9BILA|nr:hypothetical protein T11_7711 [Trichinella zimbabwensis]
MDGKKLLIPFKYNLECTIHASGSPGFQQSNVGTRSGSLDIALPGDCTSWNRIENDSNKSGTQKHRTQSQDQTKMNLTVLNCILNHLCKRKLTLNAAVRETRISSLEFS